MSLFKLPLLLLSSISYHLALERPSFPGPEDRIIVTSLRERIWRHAARPCVVFLKGTTWLATVAESMVILGPLYNKPWSSTDIIPEVLNALGPAEASQLTIPFVLGAFLTITGGIIRVQCYRTLGPYFTFEQCIRTDHKLVTTGPYAMVRHPGYSSLMMCILGLCVMYDEPGSWLRASGVLDVRFVKAAAVGWCLIQAALCITFFRRLTEEDRLLSERFGKEWGNWAGRVKYKLVPFVY